MEVIIRKALDKDYDYFIESTIKLSQFNRNQHGEKCKYDDYDLVLESIKEKADLSFNTRNEKLSIFIAEINGSPVGYALGRIYEEEKTADNGTGKIGLIDELYVDENIRQCGVGNKLINEVILWIKSRGINRVKLHAYSWNKNATHMYEKLGFDEYAVSLEKYI
ncbi:MAG: GNAT family N-acetyltransferase [Bacteroidales bacterium]